MKNKFYSYLDSFNRITIIYPKKLVSDPKEKRFYLLLEEELLTMEVTNIYELEHDYKFSCLLSESIALNIEYSVIDEANNSSLLRSGSIVRSDLFEMLYSYSRNDLGYTYNEDFTVFKVWSPVAKEIEIEIIDRDGKIKLYDLTALPRGIWQATIDGNLDGFGYRYHVRIGESFRTCLDPYAISSSANAKMNYVIDLNKTYKFQYPKPEFSGRMVDAVIYELHLRDYTIGIKSIDNPGKYLGMLEEFDTPLGRMNAINYLKNLGITHVQLMPIYDFGGVDEANPDKYYNWGYNPVQYNVPEGWFSTDPDDPYKRINELKMLIDEFHKEGIRVIMDVVYNHVYDYKSFPYEILVPGYFFRFDDNGIITNTSGCKNDVASDRKMVSKFICDSTRYWTQEFGIDGFRFDLMGLLDIETINTIYMNLKAVDPKGIMYGEGWNMPVLLDDNKRANMNNYLQMPNIGFFNDRFRNVIKGDQWSKSLGFSAGGSTSFLDILYLVTGSCVDNYLFDSPGQSINYVECHDNYTFFDALKVLGTLKDEEIKRAARLALSIVIISQGVPFIHAGEEFYRTKNLDENSYQSPDKINMIKWDTANDALPFINLVKDLISIRKDFKAFRQDRKTLIKERVTLTSDIYSRCIKFNIKNLDGTITVIIKNNDFYDYVDFKGMVRMLFDGNKRTNKLIASFEARHPGVYIFLKGR